MVAEKAQCLDVLIAGKKWGGRRDSNPQQQAPQAWTLPLSYDHQPADKLVFKRGHVKFRQGRFEARLHIGHRHAARLREFDL